MNTSLETPPLTKQNRGISQLNRWFSISSTGPTPFIRRRKYVAAPVALFSQPKNETPLRFKNKVPVVLEKNERSMTEKLTDPPVRIVAIAGEGSVSPLNNATWQEVMLHTVS